jgi:hypothetical protein
MVMMTLAVIAVLIKPFSRDSAYMLLSRRRCMRTCYSSCTCLRPAQLSAAYHMDACQKHR